MKVSRILKLVFHQYEISYCVFFLCESSVRRNLMLQMCFSAIACQYKSQHPIYGVSYWTIIGGAIPYRRMYQFISSYTNSCRHTNSYRRTPIHVVVYQLISSHTNSCRRIPIHIVACTNSRRRIPIHIVAHQFMSSYVPIQVSSINLAIAIYINYLTNVKYSH